MKFCILTHKIIKRFKLFLRRSNASRHEPRKEAAWVTRGDAVHEKRSPSASGHVLDLIVVADEKRHRFRTKCADCTQCAGTTIGLRGASEQHDQPKGPKRPIVRDVKCLDDRPRLDNSSGGH